MPHATAEGIPSHSLSGTFEGDVQQYDTEGELISDCEWSGDFAGTLWDAEFAAVQ